MITNGLPVITLKSEPKDAPNWMLFRGVSALIGIRDGLNYSSVIASQDLIAKKIENLKVNSAGKKKELIVAGHSLGAVLASAVRLHFANSTD